TIGDEPYLSGTRPVFSHPHSIQGNHVQQDPRLLVNLEPWLRDPAQHEPPNVFIGSEHPIGKRRGATLLESRSRSPHPDQSYIGVLVPTRQSYGRVMRLVRQTGAMLEEVL